MADYFVGIDLGGTNTKVGLFDNSIGLIAKTSISTCPDKSAAELVKRMARATRKLLADNNVPYESLTAAAIGSPGPLDLKKGTVIATPNLPCFKDTPLRQMVSDALEKPVALENDANAACWGEHVIGAAAGVDEMAFFTLGTGIGGGVVANGELVHGFGDNAAELGHIIIYPEGRLCGCGQKGCVEAYASATSTAKRAAEALKENPRNSSLSNVLEQNGQITSRDVFEHSAAGDELAEEITEGTAKALGLVCVNVFHATGPKKIVFAGGMIAAGDLLLDRIKYYFKKYIWSLKDEPLEICFATLGQDAGIIGTAALAKHLHNQK